MTDKELIKQKIERLDEEYRTLRVEGTTQQAKESDLVVHVLLQISNFIDSLPEQPAREDLEEEIGKYTTNHLLKKRNHSTGVYHLTQKDCDDIAHHFAEWQREKDIKLEKIEDLEEFAQKWAYSNYHEELDEVNCDCLYSGVKKGAEWQKQQMKEALQTEYEKGRFAMKEEMIEGAIDCSIILHPNDRFANYSISAYVPPLHPASTYISNGDKVKIIIVK